MSQLGLPDLKDNACKKESNRQFIESERLLVGSVLETRLVQIVRDWSAINNTGAHFAATRLCHVSLFQNITMIQICSHTKPLTIMCNLFLILLWNLIFVERWVNVLVVCKNKYLIQINIFVLSINLVYVKNNVIWTDLHNNEF